MNGEFPLFCVVPSTVDKDYHTKCRRVVNAQVCTWKELFSKGGSFLRGLIDTVMTENGIHNPFSEDLPYDELQQHSDDQ